MFHVFPSRQKVKKGEYLVIPEKYNLLALLVLENEVREERILPIHLWGKIPLRKNPAVASMIEYSSKGGIMRNNLKLPYSYEGYNGWGSKNGICFSKRETGNPIILEEGPQVKVVKGNLNTFNFQLETKQAGNSRSRGHIYGSKIAEGLQSVKKTLYPNFENVISEL